jgi:diguanylate cyclase (GGDEF)-like protein
LIGWLKHRFSQLPLGLAARFTLFVATIMLVLAAAFVVLTNNEVERAAQESFEDQASHLLALVGSVAQNLPDEQRFVDLQKVLDNVAGLNDATRYAFVSTLDAHGRLLNADPETVASEPESKLALDEAVIGRTPALEQGGGMIHIAVPVLHDQKPVAVARVGVATADLDDRIAQAASRNLLLALTFIGFAMPFTAVCMTYITSPVRKLIQATRRVSEGDYTVNLDEERQDELGELARSFAAMARNLRDSSEAVERLTYTDGASGLANREQLRLHIDAQIADSRQVALLYLDVDRLKRVNEALGIEVGDNAIAAIAERLQVTCREELDQFRRDQNGGDVEILLARLGGDEFGILLSGEVDEDTASHVAARVLRGFAVPFEVGDHSLSVSASIGIAVSPDDGIDLSTLLRTAGSGLGEAKAGVVNSFKFARRDVNSRAYRRLVIEQELRQALEREEFEVFYQPQVALHDGAMVGAEALVRWRHPQRGLVGPTDFIDIAEEVGLLDAIGGFVIDDVCRQCGIWADIGLFPKIAINVSVSQCQQPDFAANVLRAIEKAGVPPGMLEIEITETVAMLDPRATARELSPLRAAGVRLAIDDFGTGYSNLASLTRLQFDILKIDRSFVSECVRDGSARVVVATILTMAHNLGFEVVAEGVESAAQREFLVSQKCEYGQGYLFGKPMPAADFEAQFAEHRRADARDLLGQIRRTATRKGRPAA